MTDDPHTGQSAKPVFTRAIPPGDSLMRAVCTTCGFVDYQNPKIVAGAVVIHDGRFLLCKRAIAPRAGFWTIPAGYMELHETAQEAAMREAREEACADIALGALLAVYSIPRLSQVQLIYTARLNGGRFAAGPESLDVQLFTFDGIPWDELAFPSVRWALHHFRSVGEDSVFAPFSNPPGETGAL